MEQLAVFSVWVNNLKGVVSCSDGNSRGRRQKEGGREDMRLMTGFKPTAYVQ